MVGWGVVLYLGKYCTVIKLFFISVIVHPHSPDLPNSHILLLSVLLTLTSRRHRDIAPVTVFVCMLLVSCQRVV
jgi:hypothetical protein